MKPHTFKDFCLLKEQMTQTDIIDTYILMSMPDIEDPATAFVKKEIMDQARTNITNELNSIIHGELSHVGDAGNLNIVKLALQNIIGDLKDGVNLDEFIDLETIEGVNVLCKIMNLPPPGSYEDIVKNARFYLRKINELYKMIRKKQLPLQAAYNCFMHLDWVELYGGENWARITKHVSMIMSAKTPMEFFKALDRLIDFVHNTGSILDKFKGYKEGWIQFILDLKEKAINIRELIPYASPEVRKMFGSQEWRIFMKKVPGEGAETSIDSYKNIFTDYLHKIADQETNVANESARGETAVIRYWSAIAQVFNKINKRFINKMLEDIDPDIVVRALITIDLFRQIYYTGGIDKRMKLFEQFLSDYVKENYEDLYNNIKNEHESIFKFVI